MHSISQPLPKGWSIQQNSDGSFGIKGPPSKDGSVVRTGHALYPTDRSDLADIVRRMCQHAVDQSLDYKAPTAENIKLLAEVLGAMPNLRAKARATIQSAWHSPGLGEVHRDDTDHVIFEVDWPEHEVPLEDSVGDGRQEDADHAAAFNPVMANKMLDTLEILFGIVAVSNPELLRELVSGFFEKTPS